MADGPEVKVKLTAEDAGVSAAIRELTSQLKNLKKQQDETASSSLDLSKALGVIGALAGAIRLGQFAKDAFDSAVNIGKMADKTGLSTQTLSVFHKVASDVGASTETVDKGLIRATKSITEFEQGSQKATKGFALLGISAKDFAGLKPDEKIKLVTERLGGMAASFQKTTATQLIFGKGSSDLAIVMNSLAGQGFDEATKSTARLGLLLDQQTTDTFRSAKASIQELADAAKGMATQFEGGMLPAISDVAEGLLDALGDDGAGGSFKDLGKEAGTVIKGIAFGLLSTGAAAGHAAAEIEEVFDFAFNHTKEFARTTWAAIKGYITNGTAGAAMGAAAQLTGATDSATQEFVARMKAIDDDAQKAQQKIYDDLFPSEEEEERRRKARIARLRPDQTPPPDVTAPPPADNAAAKAAFALLQKQLQDELELHRAIAKQTESIDKEQYDAGLISLTEYFNRRKAAIQSDADEETALLQKELENAKAEAARLEAAKATAKTPAEADRDEAGHLAALAKVDELQTKISETAINASTKTHALDTEEFKAREENQQKQLEFEKLIDTTGQKRLEAAKLEIEIEKQKLEVILKQSGASQAAIDAELAKYTQIKLAEASYVDQQKQGESDLKVLGDQRAAIEEQVKNGKLFQAQADQQIKDLELARLPVLEQIAAALLAQAQATGDPTKIAQAQDFQKQVDAIAAQVNTAGQQVARIKQGLQDALTSGVTNFFDQLMRGSVSVGQAFKELAGSVISSLARMMAQMIAQILIAKLLKAAMSGFSGGGLVPGGSGGGAGGGGGGGGGFAEGGLIHGPGGPKSDSIPARVSPGEFIVKADAVSAFGAANLEAINRGLKVPSIERLSLPKFAEGGLVGVAGAGGGDSNINLGIGLDEGLILKHLSSKAAGNIILTHLANNPKAASKAISRSSS